MKKLNKKQLTILGIIAIVIIYFTFSSDDEPKQDEALAIFIKKMRSLQKNYLFQLKHLV